MVHAHLWPVSDGDVWRSRVELPATSNDLWYERLDEPLGTMHRLDSMLVGTLMYLMLHDAGTVRVHGPISRTLLRNLDELQCVWAKWRPQVYHRVSIEADDVVDDAPTGDGAVVAYSGGVDATFTLYRHCVGEPSWHTLPIREAVMIHGLDIALEEEVLFDRAVGSAHAIVDSTGLPISRVRTNVRAFERDISDFASQALGSVLLLFADRRTMGMIASSADYASFHYPTTPTR